MPAKRICLSLKGKTFFGSSVSQSMTTATGKPDEIGSMGFTSLYVMMHLRQVKNMVGVTVEFADDRRLR